MSKKTLFTLWGGMFILCAGLGFIPNPAGLLRWLMTALAMLFFVPAGAIAYSAWKRKEPDTLRLVRNLAAGSLGLTVAALIANFVSIAAPEAVGDVLYAVLVMVSSPMICGQIWIVSLLLWAGLMWTCIFLLKKKK